MSTIEDRTEDVTELDGQVKAKATEVEATRGELAGLREELERTAIEGGDTGEVRARIAHAEGDLEDREVQRGHLERLLDRAREGRRRRAAFAELARVYERDEALLRAAVEVARASAVLAAAREAMPHRLTYQERRNPVLKALLGRIPGREELPAELVAEQFAQPLEVSSEAWLDEELLTAEVERVKRLAVEARERA